MTSQVGSTTIVSRAPERSARAHRILVLYRPEEPASPDAGQRVVGHARVLAAARPLPLDRRNAAALLDARDGRLSRVHAAVEPIPAGEPGEGSWRVRDLGSRNGTWVNGRAVADSLLLSPGDVIRIGDHLLLYQRLKEREARALVADTIAAELLPGVSPQLALLRQRLLTLAGSKSPILITGPSGVGKDLVARALHALRHRGDAPPAPYVAINCAALSSGLQESELFGHAKGAFTGALCARPGLLREADGGTLFLDELGEMPLALQAKVLRVLESLEVRPVGSDRSFQLDLRIVAATNVQLAEEMAAGRFRGDLFARLMTHVIAVPALAARRDDILPLFARFARESGRELSLDADAAEALLCHDWPLNVRELRQLVTRLALELSSPRIQLGDLPEAWQQRLEQRAPAPGSDRLPPSIPSVLLEIPRDRAPGEAELRQVYATYAGSVSQVAAFFGKERMQIYRWLRRFGLLET